MSKSNVVARAEPALAYHIRRFKTKLASGQYQHESAVCFCGSSEYMQVTEYDRYGIDYRMGICRSCGIMFANPRLTEESAREFYTEDYRKIYDAGEKTEKQFSNAIGKGESLSSILEYFDFQPESVLDIGCNMGGMLKPFQDKGCDVLGVEVGCGASYAESIGIPVFRGDCGEITRKFDLIILNHVVEHFGDLEIEMSKIKNLLNKDGMVFIGVPGVYAFDKNMMFQNAHNWQFNRTSLVYMMECCGFEDLYCDERILSIWKYTGNYRSKKSVNPAVVSDLYNYLLGKDRKLPRINGYNKFPVKQRRELSEFWLESGVPDVDQVKKTRTGSAIIVAGGPSVNEQADRIKEMYANGTPVIAIEKMYGWCLKNDIVPDYVIAMDASDDVVDSLSAPHRDTVHLVSSQCPKGVYDHLKDHKVFLFFTPQRGVDTQKLWDKHKVPIVTQVNGGGSVTLGAFSISMMLGFSDIHIFGFDCHITAGEYAKGISGVGVTPNVVEVRIDDRIFKTTPSYLSFAQQFFDLKKWGSELKYLDRVRIYGDSLASFMSVEDIRGD